MRKPPLSPLIGFCLATAGALLVSCGPLPSDRFDREMTLGKGYLEQRDAAKAIAAYGDAVRLAPENLDARLNLANAFLLDGQSSNVLTQAEKVLSLDHNNPAAYYLAGCAWLRLNQPEQAIKAFQQSQQIDPAVSALNFQLGLAHERLGQYDEAARQFETLVQFEPKHPSAHYQLSRLYQRLGRDADAAQELAAHQQILASIANPPAGTMAYEQCKYTEPRLAFSLEQPARKVNVRFVNGTAEAFGGNAGRFRGPLGVLDCNHDGRNSLFALESNTCLVLNNQQGRFQPLAPGVQLGPDAAPGATPVYRRCLVGDLNNDGVEDVLLLSELRSHMFRFATNGQFREITAAGGLKDLKAADGLLADLDFTGKLDLLTIQPGRSGLRVYRNLGNAYFQERTAESGLPGNLGDVRQLWVEDWKNDDVPGVFATRPGQAPAYFAKLRAGPFVSTNLAAGLPAGDLIAVGDIDNDLLADVVLADDREVTVVYSSIEARPKLPLGRLRPQGLALVDYDNDGWLDLLAWGNGVRLWRNLGRGGFVEVTMLTGLDKITEVDDLVAADFDQDGDTDLVISSPAGLAFWRNDGGNANKQLKLRLAGNRSNASGLGGRVELTAGHWRALRTLHQLPFEIGVGRHEKIDVLKTRWFDLATTLLDVPVQKQPVEVVELMLPTGSCPYLYAWDGGKFRFITDILGAAPLGLPVNEQRYVEQDPDELLALGDENDFKPVSRIAVPAGGRGATAGGKNGGDLRYEKSGTGSTDDAYEVRITEELREVLYLDHAQLIVVDHPADTLVMPTSKMLPGRPFVPHELWTLRQRSSLKKATRSDGLDVTEALAAIDNKMAAPVRVREPQLRGLAEPFTITMDFGELPVQEPLVLVMHGWLRFGGGMANIGGSLDPNLPFPFPALEAELPDGTWKPVAVTVGVPAGKTKTILVDLINKLPPGTRRLRLTTAFELYWDCITLATKVPAANNLVTRLLPDSADLHWRGFSELAGRVCPHTAAPERRTEDSPALPQNESAAKVGRVCPHTAAPERRTEDSPALPQNESAVKVGRVCPHTAAPDYLPLTPDYDRVNPNPPWRRTPSGWCTRYGPVDELVRERDNSLVLLNGGDEVSLSFAAKRLPPKPDGFVRHFFLYVVGWDKDADFHVGQGWRVEPLPFHGMDDQAYGHQQRPGSLDDSWIAKYNTRWVGPMVLGRSQ